MAGNVGVRQRLPQIGLSSTGEAVVKVAPDSAARGSPPIRFITPSRRNRAR